MDKKIILGVLALLAVSIGVLLMVPDNSVSTPDTLPWKISHPTADSSRIFGITLGLSSLSDAEAALKETAEISLFKPTDGKVGIEAFIDEVNFNGLKAKIVMNVAVPADELSGMFNRGLRMNSTPSGKRITLTPDDLARVRQSTVVSFTYLPNVRLDEDIISKRFGEPAQRVRETQGGAVHWLYPQHGLDVVQGGSEKPLLQYVSPKDFEQFRASIVANGEVLK